MSQPRVLVTTHFMRPEDEVDRKLQDAGLDTVFNLWRGGRTESEMIDLLADIDGAIVSIDPFTPRVLAAAPRLKVIARTGVGYDSIDVPSATARGVAVCTTPGANHRAVAEYTMALMLQCSRKMAESLAEVPRGSWTRHPGRDLAGDTLGIVGLGTIGKEVARRARAFDMRLLAYDVVRDEEFAARHDLTYVSLEELLGRSDYVSLHIYLDESTKHLINTKRLAMMKPTAYLINTARGGIVDTQALYQALSERRIAGAALDVFEQEPLEAGNFLRDLDNAYLSPHQAAVTEQANRASGLMAAENVIQVLCGGRPPHVVNPQVLTMRS